MNKIVTSSDGKLVLSSMLTESQFARTNLVTQMEESGYIIHMKKDGVTFSEYKFSSNFTKDGTVYFSGEDFDGTLLGESLDDSDTVGTVLSALTAAIEKNLDLAAVGAGGILVRKTPAATDGNIADVLFLPGNLFERSAVNLSELDYCENQGFYFYKGLESQDALIFLRSVIAYRCLSGKFPFTKTDLLERQADIFDNAFVPLELCVFGINKAVAKSVDSGLMIFRKDDCFEGNSRFVDEKKKARLEEILNSVQKFSADSFFSEKIRLGNEKEQETAEFRKERGDYIKKQKRKIFAARIYRRNKNFIRMAAIVGIVVLYGLYSFHKTNLNLATSKGLSAEQTAWAMYSFISSADVPDLQEIVSGKETRDLIVKVASYHVRAKERVGFNERGKIVPVAERLFYSPESHFWMFGITNLSINGVHRPIFADFPKRKDKPASLTEEDSRILSKNEQKICHAEYFLVMNDDTFINVQKVSEDVTLFWDGKKWLVKSVQGTSDNSRVKMKSFHEDYKNAMQETNGNIEKSVEIIKSKYEWLPSHDDIAFYSDKF